jgi:hypothetical protein
MSGSNGAGQAKRRLGGIREDKTDLQEGLQVYHLSISPLADRQRLSDSQTGEVTCIYSCIEYSIKFQGGTEYGLGNAESTESIDST